MYSSSIILILAFAVAGVFAAESRLSAYSPPELVEAFKDKGNSKHCLSFMIAYELSKRNPFQFC